MAADEIVSSFIPKPIMALVSDELVARIITRKKHISAKTTPGIVQALKSRNFLLAVDCCTINHPAETRAMQPATEIRTLLNQSKVFP